MQRNAARHPATRQSTARHNAEGHSKAQPATPRQGTTRHDTARRGTAERGGAQHSAEQRGTAQQSTAQHSAATPKHTTAPRQGTLIVGLTRSSCLTPQKAKKHAQGHGTPPHQPTMHGLKATTGPTVQPPPPPNGDAGKAGRNPRPPARDGPPAQTATGKLSPPAPNRHRRSRGTLGNPTPKKRPTHPPAPLTNDPTKLAGTTAQPAEPGPNPTERAASPCVYINHSRLGVAGYGRAVLRCSFRGPLGVAFNVAWLGGLPASCGVSARLLGCVSASCPTPFFFGLCCLFVSPFSFLWWGLPVPPSAFPGLVHALVGVQCG